MLPPNVFVLLTIFSLAIGCSERRYVATVRGPLTSAPIAAGTPEPTLGALLATAAESAQRSGILSGIRETLHLTVNGRVTHTVVLDQGRATVSAGLVAGVSPTLTVPIREDMLRHLVSELADGKLDEAELFNVSHVLFQPCLRRVHGMFYFTEPGDKSALRVDNHMQFRLKNAQGFRYHGEETETAVTVLNVDGTFFYLDGLVGDPDIRYEFELSDALALYRTLVYEAEGHKGELLELRKLGQRTEEALTHAVTYQRAWH